MKVLVSGATGLIGRKLIYRLLTSGFEVKALTRSKSALPELPEKNIFVWSDKEIPESSCFSDVEVVIHLAGEGIADKYWTKSRKKRLWDSRVIGTKNLISAILRLPESSRPKTFISGSAIGIYGSDNEPKTEKSKLGSGFLAALCKAWENEAQSAQSNGIRTVILRTGLVLSRGGGVLAKSGPVILGSGKQWMSWIHIDDMVSFILHSIKSPQMSGPYNLTAPNPVTNSEFTKSLAKAMSIPITVHAPSLALKLILGEMSEAVLANQKVLPEKVITSGFKFQFTKIQDAISSLWKNDSLLDHHYCTRQFVPKSQQEIFPFFRDAENLELLTPPWLNFHLTKKSTEVIAKGSLIDYKLKIHRIPVHWRTVISEWNPETSFVDEQLKGPYRKWHHLHSFETVPGGTLISDEVTFQMPGWIFGLLILPLVTKDLKKIFQYRQEKIKTLYSEGRLN